MSKFGTREIVATGLGAALFLLLFMFVKIPSPIPETHIQSAYGIGAFFAVVFGPIAGGLIQFIGHALSDSIQYGSPWWSWVIASGVAGVIFGLAKKRVRVREGRIGIVGIIKFNTYQIFGNIIAWLAVAPLLDILIYSEPVNLVFTQGAVAALVNIISVGVIGTLLLVTYSRIRTGRGVLG